MARSPLLARRYARALYDLNPSLDFTELEKRAGSDVLTRPNISIDETWTALGGKPAAKEIVNLIPILQRRKRLKVLPEIIEAYRLIAEEAAGIRRATVTVARALTPEMSTRIEALIAKEYQAKSVKLTVDVDPLLVGGIMIQVGDTLVDGSVRTILKDFKAHF